MPQPATLTHDVEYQTPSPVLCPSAAGGSDDGLHAGPCGPVPVASTMLRHSVKQASTINVLLPLVFFRGQRVSKQQQVVVFKPKPAPPKLNNSETLYSMHPCFPSSAESQMRTLWCVRKLGCDDPGGRQEALCICGVDP